MGKIIDGKWTQKDSSLIRNGGFDRQASRIASDLDHDLVDAMTSAPHRLYLIASLSCPWSHRALIMYRIKRLELTVPVQIASGVRTQGYPVNGNRCWRLPGTSHDVEYMHEIYTLSDNSYTGRATVPVLWDSKTQRIASNDSLAIMKATDLSDTTAAGGGFTLYPQDLETAIDALNRKIFTKLANGVYRAGLAQEQSHYDDAVGDVFDLLDLLEARLSRGRFLFGQRLTLSDVILFPVLVRFDIVYHTHFRCTRRRLVDYPLLWAYARDLRLLAPFGADIDFDAIQTGYFVNDGDHNPYNIISESPEADWFAPQDRAAMGDAMVSLRAGGITTFDTARAEIIQKERTE